MNQSKTIYPEEFKRNIVQLHLLTGKSPEQLEQDWAVESGLLLIWKQQFENHCFIEPSAVEKNSHINATPRNNRWTEPH
ncbi:MAG: transposase [Caldilineaceae bacterium]